MWRQCTHPVQYGDTANPASLCYYGVHNLGWLLRSLKPFLVRSPFSILHRVQFDWYFYHINIDLIKVTVRNGINYLTHYTRVIIVHKSDQHFTRCSLVDYAISQLSPITDSWSGRFAAMWSALRTTSENSGLELCRLWHFTPRIGYLSLDGCSSIPLVGKNSQFDWKKRLVFLLIVEFICSNNSKSVGNW